MFSGQVHILTRDKFSTTASAVSNAGVAKLSLKEGVTSGGNSAMNVVNEIGRGLHIIWGFRHIRQRRVEAINGKNGVQPMELCSELLYAKFTLLSMRSHE